MPHTPSRKWLGLRGSTHAQRVGCLSLSPNQIVETPAAGVPGGAPCLFPCGGGLGVCCSKSLVGSKIRMGVPARVACERAPRVPGAPKAALAGRGDPLKLNP